VRKLLPLTLLGRWARKIGIALPMLAACLPNFARAEFALALSPPRFELDAKAGEVLREVIAVSNASTSASSFHISTADWSYSPSGAVEFSEPLSPNSCRPWVAIERRDLIMAPGGQYRFRFEVTAPPATPAMECRFALLFEGQESQAKAGDLNVPMSARMAVIVYVELGGARAHLSVVDNTTQLVNGHATPVMMVRNEGLAHGRVDGFLSGSDASGDTLEFTPSTAPILPGETRAIPLQASRLGDADKSATLVFPVAVKGKLELGEGRSQEVDLHFAP
jgi:hypothetical protein